MSYQALTTAITGLRAAQQQLSVISNNVSNATTEGYNRQILPQSTQILQSNGQTVGVLTERVIRVVNMNLQRDLWTQVSASNMQEVQVQYLQQIRYFNGPPDKEFSIASKIADLRDSFSALSDIPDDTQALESTLNQAHIVADKFNDYADLIMQLRNDTQGDLQSSVNRINNLLQEITNINIKARGANNFKSSVAAIQDQRDIAIKALTEEMDISFFERSDGVLVVQTREGYELAGDVAHTLRFQGVPIGPQQYYPESASGLFLIHTTNNQETAIDITERDIGGRIGGLLEMRDSVLPSYHAQLDELAYQMASRFNAQGLKLFTDQNGNIPAGTAPDPNSLPLPTPVPYVDFARLMQVNSQIDNDHTLLQRGTYTSEVNIPTGDNALVRRVLEYTFGNVEYQEAVGTTNLNVLAPANELQGWLGLQSENRIVSNVDLSSFQEIDDGVPGTNTDLIEILANSFPTFPANDTFQLTFEESRLTPAIAPIQIDISLNTANATPGIDALDQIINQINTQIAAAGFPAGLTANATRNNYGQLIIESNGNITIDASSGFANAMGTDALNAIGLQEGTFITEDPSFNVQVGNQPPVNITIEPGDTILDLQDKLEWDAATQTGVPGLFVDRDILTGTFTLRPGIDDSNGGRQYGGDIKITGEPFNTSGAINATLPDGINIVSAIFGSFTNIAGVITENSPTKDVAYSSEITNGSGTYTNIRNNFLGPNASISTGIFSANNLLDYAQKIIDETSQDYLQAQSAFENEDTLRGILQRQFSDHSGVNIDEEMSNLIVVQTAYAASARAITAADEMFQELLDAFR